MTLERLRRQHNLDTRPEMRFRHSRNGRYVFQINPDNTARPIFYAIAAADFWAGSGNTFPAIAPVEAVRPALPEPPRNPGGRRIRRATTADALDLIRAEHLRPGDIVSRKQTPASKLTVHAVTPSATDGKTRIAYSGGARPSKGHRTSDAFNGEKFILHSRTK